MNSLPFNQNTINSIVGRVIENALRGQLINENDEIVNRMKTLLTNEEYNFLNLKLALFIGGKKAGINRGNLFNQFKAYQSNYSLGKNFKEYSIYLNNIFLNYDDFILYGSGIHGTISYNRSFTKNDLDGLLDLLESPIASRILVSKLMDM